MDSYRNPFQELEALRRGIDDAFATVWPAGAGRHSAFLPGRSARSYPLLTIAARDDRFVIDALAPSLDQNTLEVTIDRNVLTISGERRDLAEVVPEKFHRRERAVGRFTRTVRLDSEIDEDERLPATRQQSLYLTPAVDIYEDNDGLVVVADVPGLERDDLDISMEDNVPTLRLPHAEHAKPKRIAVQ